MVGFNIQLLGTSKSHLELPSKLIAIAPAHRQAEMSHWSGQNNAVFYYQNVCHGERARDADQVVHNGQGELEDSQPPSRTKATEKGKSKMTLQDIKTENDVTLHKKLTKKDYNRPELLMQSRLN